VFEGQATTSYTADTTPPELWSYDLDMDAGTLRLIFSETVNVYQMQIWELALQEFGTQAAGTYRQLINQTVATSTAPSHDVTFTISAKDMNAIKL
jgi:hypothetical protein